MIENKEAREWPLARFIVPAFPAVNIFTRQARKMTSLGPIIVATCASKVWGWRVEIIDENNYTGPVDKQNLPDHQAIQKERPATIVGFYCGLSSTMDRVFELVNFYKQQNALVIAGGWHVHYCPEEALANGVDVVIHGEAENVIQTILDNKLKGISLDQIQGISFKENGQMRRNLPERLEIPDLCSLPYPDFGLLRYGRKIKYYSISWTRGCSANCEFCSVKDSPRWSNPHHFFETINYLVQTRKARHFFVVDDRFNGNRPGTIEFLKLIAGKYGNRLSFTVQIRLETAKDAELLEEMKKAGVKTVCIGYESPIDEELKEMQKGYLSKNMIEWTKILKRYFWVHGMFIFGYPSKGKPSTMSVKERGKRFKRFIRRAKIDSIQILRPVPLVGTELRERLEKAGRILEKDLVPWSKYDGSYVCFMPDDMSLRELQDIPARIMKWFYSPFSFFRIPIRTALFPLDYFIRGWSGWHRGWWRDIVNYGGHRLIQKLDATKAHAEFLEKLDKFGKTKNNSDIA